MGGDERVVCVPLSRVGGDRLCGEAQAVVPFSQSFVFVHSVALYVASVFSPRASTSLPLRPRPRVPPYSLPARRVRWTTAGETLRPLSGSEGLPVGTEGIRVGVTYRSSSGPRRSFTPQPSSPGFAPVPESAAGHQESGNFPIHARRHPAHGLPAVYGLWVSPSGPRDILHEVSMKRPRSSGQDGFRPGALCRVGARAPGSLGYSVGTGWVRD